MKSLARYAFTNSRVRALLASLLNEHDLAGLVEARDIDQAIELLKNTEYREPVADFRAGNDLQALERRLRENSIQIHKRIVKSLSGPPRELVFLLLSRYEVEDLKNILRLWYGYEPLAERKVLNQEQICYSLPVEKLLSAESIEEIIVLLDHSPYKQALLAGRDKFKEKGALFYLEVALDQDYYRRLWEKIKDLAVIDRRRAGKLLGIEVDIENISCLLRLKQYYKLSLAEVTSCLLPGGCRVKIPHVKDFYANNDIKVLLKDLSAVSYTAIEALAEAASRDNKSGALLLEALLQQILLKEVKHILAGYPFTIGTVVSYLILQRLDMKNIVCLLYSKFYERSAERIRKKLITDKLVV